MAQRWEDERYVRLYTRDTVGWKMLPWQGKALLSLLFRKVDRAGLLDVGEHGVEGLAALVELPFEIVEVGVAALLKSRTIKWTGDRGQVLFIPNFLPAQEAHSSDAQRKRDQRERAAAAAALAGLGVTPCVEESRNVTDCPESGREVTRGHTESRAVTDGHSVPIRAVPSFESLSAHAPARVETDAERMLMAWKAAGLPGLPGSGLGEMWADLAELKIDPVEACRVYGLILAARNGKGFTPNANGQHMRGQLGLIHQVVRGELTPEQIAGRAETARAGPVPQQLTDNGERKYTNTQAPMAPVKKTREVKL